MKYKGSAVIVLAILLLFLVSYFIPALKMESSENRTLATFHMVLHPEANSVVYHESLAERLDDALSDQFSFREVVVKKYLSLFNMLENLTQAFDTSWFNSYIDATAADHYQEIVDAIPDYVKSDHLVYQDLNDYMNIHYKTDHHWNNRGAKRGG